MSCCVIFAPEAVEQPAALYNHIADEASAGMANQHPHYVAFEAGLPWQRASMPLSTLFAFAAMSRYVAVCKYDAEILVIILNNYLLKVSQFDR